MSGPRVVVAGGGAAGFFAAIACAEANPNAPVLLLERSPRFLAKVRISGGGRCNVTHACFDPRELAARYPRGGRALIGPFQTFQPRDTVAWFESRGIALKTEPDGRMFPVTDSSATIVDALTHAARDAGVTLRHSCGLDRVNRHPDGGFALAASTGETLHADRLLLALGGLRSPDAAQPAAALGHAIEPPVPSLFTFRIASPFLRDLPGLSVDPVELSVPGLRWRERGPLLITHAGLSGPAVLRLSAWAARDLHHLDYRFPLRIHWAPGLDAAALADALARTRTAFPARRVVNQPALPLPARLWRALVLAVDLTPETRWAELPRATSHRLVERLLRTEFPVDGKSLNKDEFVTCGGIHLADVDLRTMESRLCPGLHFAGEILDIDGLTGGFNFQAAWTTGWIAGRAMAAAPAPPRTLPTPSSQQFSF